MCVLFGGVQWDGDVGELCVCDDKRLTDCGDLKTKVRTKNKILRTLWGLEKHF